MKYAYDKVLKLEVDAFTADSRLKSRFICPVCKEWVFLAKKEDGRNDPHFRHYKNNNNQECEDYTPQYRNSIIEPIAYQKEGVEKIGFYFKRNDKKFYIRIRMTKEEISTYESQSASIQLRRSLREEPFDSIKIDRKNFMPNEYTDIYVKVFSATYILTTTCDKKTIKCEAFKLDPDNTSTTFFKVQIGEDRNWAKVVSRKNNVVYEGAQYFVAVRNDYKNYWNFKFTDGIEVETFDNGANIFNIQEMMGIWGKFITIKKKTSLTTSEIEKCGYRLEESRSLILLWPPAIKVNNVNMIHTDYSYIYSTTRLEYQTNTTINHREDIEEVLKKVYKITI